MINSRMSGILLHITSLPSQLGIGDIGPWAKKFADFLERSGQRVWQILPLNPTRKKFGNSPYSGTSAFAGNPLLISLDLLVQNGLLQKSELTSASLFSLSRVNYPTVIRYREPLFAKAFLKFKKKGWDEHSFSQFCNQNAFWLDDYALFEALRNHFNGSSWNNWPPGIRDREINALEKAKNSLALDIEKHKFLQFIFYRQWTNLKSYCNKKNIQVIGDIPLYIHYDSADVWAHRDMFKLDREGNPVSVSGVPPDFFSAQGQLWGNPLYRWDIMKQERYSWWMRRMSHNLMLFDMIRLDHFRGFAGYWEVPASHKTAKNGKWVSGPGEHFFNALLRRFQCLPIIAEDLGYITPDVIKLKERFGFTGMRILQFGFSEEPLSSIHRPHSYRENCVGYTGTHDNNTLLGWLFENPSRSVRSREEIADERERAFAYVGCGRNEKKGVHWEFIRVLMMSHAALVVFPMQDILGLGEKSRMNQPGTVEDNWEWRLIPDHITPSTEDTLKKLTVLYERI